MPKHGTFYGYTSGCRCKLCKRSNAEHRRFKTGGGSFGISIGARWRATVDFLHVDSMSQWR